MRDRHESADESGLCSEGCTLRPRSSRLSSLKKCAHRSRRCAQLRKCHCTCSAREGGRAARRAYRCRSRPEPRGRRLFPEYSSQRQSAWCGARGCPSSAGSCAQGLSVLQSRARQRRYRCHSGLKEHIIATCECEGASMNWFHRLGTRNCCTSEHSKLTEGAVAELRKQTSR